MTIYSNDMKSYGMRNGVAKFLEMPREQVRVVWLEGPQGYGRTAADDAGFEAAYIAKEIGRSESRAHQLHSQAIHRLSGFMARQRGLFFPETLPMPEGETVEAGELAAR